MNKILYVFEKTLLNFIMILLCINITLNSDSYLVSALENNVVGDEPELLAALSNPDIDTIVLSADIYLTTALKIERSVAFVSDSDVKRMLYSPVDNIAEQNKRHILVYGGEIILSFENVELIGSNVEVTGGGIHSFADTLTLDNAVIKNCNAYNGAGVQTAGTVIVNGGTISQNKAISGGGGIFGTFIIVNDGAEISGNTAVQGGGIGGGNDSVITINGGGITGNTSGIGGGIYGGLRSRITIDGGEISGNKLGESDAFGGGIVVKADSTVTVTSGLISGNKANWGGGMANYGNGRAVFNISGGLITDNIAGSQGGGIYCNSASELNVSGEAKIIANRAGSGGAIFANVNTAINITGGEIGGNEAVNSGGAIYAYNYDALPGCFIDINISGDAKIIGNKALNGGAVRAISERRNSDVITLNIFGEAEINGNTAANNGGGISDYAGYPGDFIINISENAKINGNKAINGGGIYASQDSTVINISNNAQITNNTASNDGGGIWIKNYQGVTANGAELAGNTARAGYQWELDDKGFDGKITDDAATHKSNIMNTIYSDDFTNAYNNYDINYEIYIVKFIDGDELIETRNIYKNSLIGDSFALSKTNAVFNGWFDEDIEWDFDNDLIENNVTLYAKWSLTEIPSTNPPTEIPPVQNQIIQENITATVIPDEINLTEPTQVDTEIQEEYTNPTSDKPILYNPEETFPVIEEMEETEIDIDINENDIPLGESGILPKEYETPEEIFSPEPDEPLEPATIYIETTENTDSYIEPVDIIPINEADPVEIEIISGNVPPLSSGVIESPKTTDSTVIIIIILLVSAILCGILFRAKQVK